ncbi:uncharacterized protein LOC116007459 [Ipomoea triloba]|uniref:uncharacterized protein LOC116007459 n=1 Tax=Ipomoea triloba TaxID=35885 RepID=UPI00125E0D34|nr:uncharacterized protein LOC116007459 [Ipomoea triloba]
MAVSLYFYTSLNSHEPPIQGLDKRRSRGGKSLFRIKCPAVKALMTNYLNRGMLTVNRRRHCFLRHTTHLPLHISHNFDVGPCTEMLISGFWVGPDIEDGWGFVQAIVHQTY